MKKNVIKYVTIVIAILFAIMIALLFVTRPAIFGFFELGDSPSSIGSAIGGIGAVIVGIANVIMLYLTFSKQQDLINNQIDLGNKQKGLIDILNKKIDTEIKERSAETKYSQYLQIRTQLDNLKQSWLSKTLTTSDGKTYTGLDAISYFIETNWTKKNSELKNRNNFLADIYLSYHDMSSFLETTTEGKLQNNYKTRLLSDANIFYKTFMAKSCMDLIARDTENEVKWTSINRRIEEMLS